MNQQPFSDRLHQRIQKMHSWLVAGCDPMLDDFPPFLVGAVNRNGGTLEERVEQILVRFYTIALDAIGEKIAAIKPNLAFFEQYGIAGLKAYQSVVTYARSQSVPVIADAKRGDIGSTAQAYANAFLGKTSAFGETINSFEADALTVNPFLGFDTMEVFLQECVRHGKGLFILVKTSNPGSGDLQDLRAENSESVSKKIAHWIREHGSSLVGKSGLSGLGAVVGATYPEELAELRKAMPTSFFLIPGLGAQGGKASDTVQGFVNTPGSSGYSGCGYSWCGYSGAIVNVSRGLFGKLPQSVSTEAMLAAELRQRVEKFNSEISAALSLHPSRSESTSSGR